MQSAPACPGQCQWVGPRSDLPTRPLEGTEDVLPGTARTPPQQELVAAAGPAGCFPVLVLKSNRSGSRRQSSLASHGGWLSWGEGGVLLQRGWLWPQDVAVSTAEVKLSAPRPSPPPRGSHARGLLGDCSAGGHPPRRNHTRACRALSSQGDHYRPFKPGSQKTREATRWSPPGELCVDTGNMMPPSGSLKAHP